MSLTTGLTGKASNILRGCLMDVGIWIRVSTDDQAKGESPETHRERGRYYCLAKNWNIVELYDLSGVSGKSALDHSEAKRMLEDIKSGRIKGLVFSKLARLARNTKDLLEISEIFQKHDASLISIEESIDTSTPAGRLLYTVIGALAQWEREEISARVAASVPIRAQRGLPTGGIGPFGYHWLDKQLVPNPIEAPTVKRAFELFTQIGKILTVCERLNKEGLRSRKSLWRPTSLKRILTDSTYIGRKRANYSSSNGDGKSWKEKPKEVWVYVQVEPIIDTATWDTVQNILISRTSKSSRGVPKEGKFLYSGILICHCGQKMYVQAYEGMKVPRYVCKVCKNKINEDIVTEHFRHGLEKMVLSPDQLKLPDLSKEITDKEQLIQAMKRELLSLKSKIEQAWDAKHNVEVDDKGFRERYTPLRDRKDAIEHLIPKLEAEIAAARVANINQDYILQEARRLSELWDILTDDEKGKVAKELIRDVVVGEDTLDFALYHLPQFSELGNDDRTSRD